MKIFTHNRYLQRIPILLLTLLFPVIVYAQTDTEPTINSKLNGTVLDAASKQPIPGAVVKIKVQHTLLLRTTKGNSISLPAKNFLIHSLLALLVTKHRNL